MKREELAVTEACQADRITFRFARHPRRQRQLIYVQIGKRRVWRSEVRRLRVEGDRLIVELQNGKSFRTAVLVGLTQERVSEAFAQFDPTDPEQLAEREAAERARRSLDPIVAASQGSAK